MQSPEDLNNFEGIPALDLTKNKLCITFSEKSAKAIFEVGCRNVIWVPHSIRHSNIDKLIENNYGLLDSMSEIWLDTGIDDRLASEFARRLDPGRIRVIKYPSPYMSANLVLYGHSKLGLAPLGKQALYDCLMEAKAVRVEGLFSAHDLESEVLDLYKNGEKLGISLGWRGFRTASGKDMLRVHRGTTMAIGGIPNMGKSRLAKNIMVNLAKSEGWKFGVFDKETKPRKTIAQLCAIYLERPFRPDVISGQMTEEELRYGMEWVDRHFFFIRPPKGEYTVDNLIAKSKELVNRTGIHALTVDAWNNLSVRRPKGTEAYEYLAESLEKMNDHREESDLFLTIVVHPPKVEKNKKGEYDPLGLYDDMGGSHWANKLDVKLSVHRNKFDQAVPVDIAIQKIRDEDMGILGTAKMLYDPSVGIYYDGDDEGGFPIYGESVIETTKRHEPMILVKK